MTENEMASLHFGGSDNTLVDDSKKNVVKPCEPDIHEFPVGATVCEEALRDEGAVLVTEVGEQEQKVVTSKTENEGGLKNAGFVNTYSQKEVEDLLAANNNKVQREVEKAKREGEAKWQKEKEDIQHRQSRLREISKTIWFKIQDCGLGSGTCRFEKLGAFVEMIADNQLRAEEVESLRRRYEDEKNQFKEYYEENQKLKSESRSLKEVNWQLSEQFKSLSTQFRVLEEEKKKCEEESKEWEKRGNRLLTAVLPKCLSSEQWFIDLQGELQDQILQDGEAVPDAAMLVFAALAEFAVLERRSTSGAFDWQEKLEERIQKQLVGIGGVVANYMHQTQVEESKVMVMLRHFAQAFAESDLLTKFKIRIMVPNVGTQIDNTREVKHRRNGMEISRIFNWCVSGSAGVYSKAEVE